MSDGMQRVVLEATEAQPGHLVLNVEVDGKDVGPIVTTINVPIVIEPQHEHHYTLMGTTCVTCGEEVKPEELLEIVTTKMASMRSTLTERSDTA